MLFNRRTQTARDANFVTETKSLATVESQVDETAVASSVRPTPEQLQIAGLKGELESLHEELKELRETWDEALTEAEVRARARAAAEHVAEEQAILEQIRAALAEARDAFDAGLAAEADQLAQALAGQALARLVEPMLGESEWLARSITRRVGELRAGAMVGLRLAPGAISDTELAGLQELLPPGTAVSTDRDLPPGSASISLLLGEVPITPGKGLAAVLDMLDGDRVEG